MSEERRELTDEEFAKLAPLLPPQKPRTGRPANDHRTVLEGIIWVLRTGAPWRDLPARYGSPGTVSSRVLSHAPCSVLVARTTARNQD